MREPRYPIAQDDSMLPVIRALLRCHERADRMLGTFAEARGLTSSQCDVLFTLGDTEGLPFKELSGLSHVSGGTLTPVLNRLEAKGLVQRCKHPSDCRQIIVKLTPEGQALYEATFLPMVDQMRARLIALSPDEQTQLTSLLDKLAVALT